MQSQSQGNYSVDKVKGNNSNHKIAQPQYLITQQSIKPQKQ